MLEKKKHVIIFFLIVFFVFCCEVIKNSQNETSSNPNNTETNSSSNGEEKNPETEEITLNNGSKDSPDNLIEKYPFNSMIRMEKSSDVAKDIVLLDYKKYEVPSDYNVDVIDIHAYDENKVYVALLKHGFGNYTQFETISIGYVDLETNEYVKIKDINNQSRIADFKMMKGKLIYTLVPKTPEVLKSDFLVYFVIEEDAGKKTIIDQGQVVYAMDTPFLTIYNNKIYYPKTSVDYHKKINRQEGDFDLDYKFELIEYNPQTTERKLLDSSRGVYSDNHGGFLPEVYIFDAYSR